MLHPRCLALLLLSFVTAVSAETGRVNWTIRPVPEAPAAQRIRVTPDRADWTYAVGETPRFTIRVVQDPYPANGVEVTYRLGPEMLPVAEQRAVVPAGGLTIDGGTLQVPGFIRCVVTATIDGKPQRALATAGFSPERIQPTQTEPANFDAFWADQKAQLAKVPLDPKLTPAPELSTAKVEVFHLSLQNVGSFTGTSRVHGVLAVPRAEGRYPAVLQVPGAGVRGYRGNLALAEQGVITLQIGIHGIPVNLPAEVYADLGSAALNGYNRFNLDDPHRYYYRRVYLGCVRANDYLAGHPKWDGRNLVVMGGSQGGQLSVVTAALDPRVTFLAADYPAYSDVTGYLHGRAGGWPGLFRAERPGERVTLRDDDPRLATTRLYDAVNFARRLKVPGHYWWGYNDETCPPTSTFALYNVITAPKELVIAPQQGHAGIPEQGRTTSAWVLARVGARK